MRTLFLFCASLLSVAAHAAPRAAEAKIVGPTSYPGLERWAVSRADGPTLDMYVARTEGTKPLVLLVQGSHCLPLFLRKPKRDVSTLFVRPDELAPELSRVSFAVVERRGLRSFGPAPATDEEGKKLDHCTAEHGGVAKGERIADVVAAIEALRGQRWVSSVYVLGHSEGADVASGVGAQLGASLGGLGLLSGPGPTRFFDDIAVAHRHGDLNAVKQALDDLISLTGPNPPAEYSGASRVRQQTYAIDTTPLDELRRSHLPLFIAGGTRDEKAPIESADLVAAELLRDPKRALHYVILPELDHGYHTKDGADRMPIVLHAFVDWLLDAAHDRDRSVRIGL